MASRSTMEGFTLVEILVSFVILALVGTALLQLFQSGMGNLARAQEYNHAALLAHSKFNELSVIDDLSEIDLEGELDEKYRFRIETLPYTDDELPPAPSLTPILVHLIIYWGNEPHIGNYRVSFLMLTQNGDQGL